MSLITDDRHNYSGYTNRGCRCDVCREAKRRYERERRSKGPQPSQMHGARATYDCGCRCDSCKAARATYYAKYERPA